MEASAISDGYCERAEMLRNPKTTIAGYLGLFGTILAAIGAAFPGKGWAQGVLALGIALKASDSVGNIMSQDGEH